MLDPTIKPTCAYSFTVPLPFKPHRPQNSALSIAIFSSPADASPTTTPIQGPFFVTSHRRPRFLPATGLTHVDSSIQSP